ncbi:MAG: hypothetical protein ACXAB7_11765, partial [Candidatus Kariarchaeaceae archaeon]
NAWNVTIESNTIRYINATTNGTSYPAEAYGIAVATNTGIGEYLNQLKIIDNKINDVYASGFSEYVRMISIRADEVDRVEISDNILTNTETISVQRFFGINVENLGASYNNKTLIHNNEIRTSAINNLTYGIRLRADTVYDITITDNYQDTKSRFYSNGIILIAWEGQ